MPLYKNVVLKISARFEGREFHHVTRDSNQAVDVLARMGTKRGPVHKNSFLERLFKPSVVWQDNDNIAGTSDQELITPPIVEPDEQIIGGSAPEETPLAHDVMPVIAS